MAKDNSRQFPPAKAPKASRTTQDVADKEYSLRGARDVRVLRDASKTS